MRTALFLICGLVPCVAGAAERKFDFSAFPEDRIPPVFRSTVTGSGKPGDWKVIMDEMAPTLPPLSPQAPVVTKRAVLAQLDRDPTDEHFPLLIFEAETFGDFVLTTLFKTVQGEKERMAGIAFRIQNETNYYVARASSLGNTFRFYKVIDGQREALIGPEIQIPSGVWHQLTIDCKGNQIRFLLNGKQIMPTLTDNPFGNANKGFWSTGKIGFWTKSDSVSYFTDTKIVYTPREVPAQILVRDMLKNYPRLLGLKIYAADTALQHPRLVASTDEKELGKPGTSPEQDVIDRGVIYYGKDKGSVSVTMPLRDRNGDAIAAARVTMKSFPGQTEQNAIARAVPIVKDMQARVQSLEDLVE
jgi:hypothetical protein